MHALIELGDIVYKWERCSVKCPFIINEYVFHRLNPTLKLVVIFALYCTVWGWYYIQFGSFNLAPSSIVYMSHIKWQCYNSLRYHIEHRTIITSVIVMSQWVIDNTNSISYVIYISRTHIRRSYKKGTVCMPTTTAIDHTIYWIDTWYKWTTSQRPMSTRMEWHASRRWLKMNMQ